MTELNMTPEQHDRPSDNVAVAMDTEVTTRTPMTALQRLKEELQSKRNLDVGFENTEFNIEEAIDMTLELDKYTQISIFNAWKFFLNMQCIRQAMRILPAEGIEKTSDGRDQYDHLIAHTMQDYEQDGDFAPKLPAFVALNDRLRSVMYEEMLEPTPMSDTLEFMLRTKPIAANFEKDYDERVRLGQRPGISKREFCELQLEDALRQHAALAEQGQAAIEFCNDLNVNGDRGYSDLPDWAITALHDKFIDKLYYRWSRLDIRRTGPRTAPNDRIEAQADQTLIEHVYEHFTGRAIATEY